MFKRVKEDKTIKNPAIGTWNHLSSSGVNEKGEKWSTTNAIHSIFQTINPTHWMRINYKDNKFENAYGGTYRMEGNKIYPNFEMISFTPPKDLRVEVVQSLEANKLQWNVIVNSEKGKSVFENVFEKADAKMTKSVSTK